MKFKGCVFCWNGKIYGYILGCITNSTTHNELVEKPWFGIEIRIPLLCEFNNLEILEIEKCISESLYKNSLSKENEELFIWLEN